jgi:hypothetical protein
MIMLSSEYLEAKMTPPLTQHSTRFGMVADVSRMFKVKDITNPDHAKSFPIVRTWNSLMSTRGSGKSYEANSTKWQMTY